MNCQAPFLRGQDPTQITRRWFFRDCAVGLGGIALASLLQQEGRAEDASGAPDGDPLAPKKPHFPAKAKRVVYLFMAGAPSHLELFDYKPQLAKFDGTLPPPELLQGYRAAFINPNSKL
ncbi:MAG TPA: sulfatase, partial [Planctomycetales bacterium]|nr:sulfatase [Planctomycetales bacterium]